MRKRLLRLLGPALLLTTVSAHVSADDDPRGPRLPVLYENPALIERPDGGLQTNCADPTLIRAQRSDDPFWYAICTSDSLADDDVNEDGSRREHLLPMIRTRDLAHWEYVGDAFEQPPAWAAATARLWAPELVFIDGRYHLYYTVTDVTESVSGEPNCDADSAIGVATSESPLGPWVDAGRPVVMPRRGGDGCNFFWSYDPDVLLDTSGGRYLYYGSYYGGIEVRELEEGALTTDPETATPVAIPNRYEATEVVERDGSYYLLASASNCCNGPLTGYQVFVGRSDSPLGPFRDRTGHDFLAGRVGGTPFLTLNGNRWVGTGHATPFRDAVGDWYAAYHAVDVEDPYFLGDVGYTKRPLLFDRITWDDGWPQVRHGLGASDTPQPAPLARVPHDPYGWLAAARRSRVAWLDWTDPNAYLLWLDHLDTRGLEPVPEASDEFAAPPLAGAWTWVRPPSSEKAAVDAGALSFATQAGDLFAATNSASVLTRAAPTGDYLIEAKVELDLPDEGCCFNYVQAGLLIYGDDDRYIKLSQVSIWDTRQTEFAKEVIPAAPGYPAYGSGLAGVAGRTTWLRIAKVTREGEERYVSFTSTDGLTYTRGPVWAHALGASAKIGLVALGGTGFTARFDYVRTYRLAL
ncbi:MAG: Arabinan endo,5-alpha-L-arabinosidase [Myxococcaceae bacterium]|nr:Arabinan endo,5-alpha-L-arabinosidase [Myxococcaceae bacterium]